MADLAPVYDTLRKANAAGDTASVAKLSAYIKSFDAPSQTAPVGEGAGGLSWPDVASQAADNLGSSMAQFGKDMIRPLVHPVDTARAVGSLGLGLIELAIPGEQADEKTAKAVGDFFVKRYGGIERLKKTLATDPVGIMGDVAGLFSGGSMAVLKLSGKTARILAKMAVAVDPAQLALKAAGGTAKFVSNRAADIAGITSGVGGDVVREAAKAGAAGGTMADMFQRNLRGEVPVSDVLQSAKSALDKIRAKRGAAYRNNMDKIKIDKSVLDFGAIDKAMAHIAGIGQYKGKVLNRSAQDTWASLDKVVGEWRSADPSKFHTPEGLDALKKAVGDIRDNTDFGKPNRVVANSVYKAIKDVIVKQAPEYARVMREYQQASDIITDIERTLSMKPNASVDTQLRKLQSVMRNNVNTSFGRRKSLVGMLDAEGTNIIPQIAGQSASSWTPRGLQGAVGSANVLGQVASLLGGGLNPLMPATLLAQSPRLVGEAAYYAGKASGAGGVALKQTQKVLAKSGPVLYQTGRAPSLLGN